ncbi:hypothetical protein [Eisenbergiella porci]|uniref:hypothetical protein n=1 Tax=Eisenbergiella porci TaxID=2652274 RepID=UPI002A81E3EE|nr:hypothetical protein [Eisenbergiella porci]
MLIRPCYKVLKAIFYLCKDGKNTDSISLMVYFHHKVNKLDLNDSLRQLICDGYLTAIDQVDYLEEIRLTYKGRHYFQYRWLDVKNLLINSFILPILVALITTLITLAVNGVFTAAP